MADTTSSQWRLVEPADGGIAYYFNDATQESAWTDPEASVGEATAVATDDTPRAESQAEGQQAATAAAHNQQAAGGVGDDVVGGVGDHGWVELVDPGMGNPYFHHAERGESSWVKPAEMQQAETATDAAAAATAATAAIAVSAVSAVTSTATEAAATEATATEATATDAATEAPGEGWAECKDESGSTYYHHTGRRQSSWERPPEMDAAVNEFEMASAPEMTETPLTIVTTAAATTAAATEDAASKGNKGGEEMNMKPKTVATAASARADKFARLRTMSSGGKFVGVAASAGAAAAAAAATAAGVGASGKEATRASMAKDSGGQQEHRRTLSRPDDGWAECLDESSGYTYYHHKGRRQSSWERPPEMDAAIAAFAAAAAESSPVGPSASGGDGEREEAGGAGGAWNHARAECLFQKLRDVNADELNEPSSASSSSSTASSIAIEVMQTMCDHITEVEGDESEYVYVLVFIRIKCSNTYQSICQVSASASLI